MIYPAMPGILRTLREADRFLLPVLARAWGVPIDGEAGSALIEPLSRAMRDPALAELMWDSLDDQAHGALQTLVSIGGKMPQNKFERLFGPIRQMGAAQVEREDPLAHPASPAEALYYRGLIGRGFENAQTGQQAIVYVPDELRDVLPLHKTAYHRLEAGDDEPMEAAFEIEPLSEVANIQPADTSIVDDMTTLLAYLQLHTPLLEGDHLGKRDLDRLLPFFLKSEPERAFFLFGLGISADLIDVQSGRAAPKRGSARRWLSATRPEQVQHLALAWRDSPYIIDLAQVPGLYPEMEAGTLHQYNPVAARGIVLTMMRATLPQEGWWPLSEFIELVREDNADFQRPNGDFDSWYIRNEAGEYLSGLESWDAVEGALLEHLIARPLHWLGLVDLADEAARFTAYGRSFLNAGPWPSPPEPTDTISVNPDGLIAVSRKVSRIDRFQIARFSDWIAAGQVFTYRLTAAGLERAYSQGITTAQIAAFLERALGDTPVPPAVLRLLETWQSGPSAVVSLERMLVLRTTAPEILDRLADAPATRRFLGARLGPMAIAVRAEHWEGLRAALNEQGIQIEFHGE
ncbi:MAG: helicase-associated domain-containing protein [Aggregatilineales bacterium]